MRLKHKASFFTVIACGVLLALMWLFPQSQQTANAATTDPFCTQQLGPWQVAAPIPVAHVEGPSAVVNGRLYVFSGFTDTLLQATNVIDVYNPATNVWESIAAPRNPMPFAGTHMQAVVDGRFVWLAGGFIGTHPAPPTDAVWRYDTVNDLWTPGPPLPEARASAALVRNGRNLHYIGGLPADRDTDQANHWVMNIDNPVAWTAAAPLPVARNHLSGVAIDGIVYAFGGQFGHDLPDVPDQAIVHAYNPATDAWTQLADLPMPRSHAEPGTFVLNDRAILVGGRNNQRPVPHVIETIVEFNPQTGAWADIGLMPTRLMAPASAVIGNQFIVTAGGLNYDEPQQNTWVAQVISNCVVAGSQPPPPAPTVALSIGMTGELVSSAAGRRGDTVTWAVTINNVGTADTNISVNVELDPMVSFADIQLPVGTYTVSGQTITIDIGNLGLGGTFTFNVETTISGRVLSGVLTSTATVSPTGQAASAIVRVLPPVTALPSTGESPLARSVFFAAAGLFGLMALVAGLRFAVRFRWTEMESAAE